MDQVAADVGRAEKSILEILPAGAAKRPDELIAAIEHRDPKIRRDVARGAIWSLLNGNVIEATAQGTLQRPSGADLQAPPEGTLRGLDAAE